VALTASLGRVGRAVTDREEFSSVQQESSPRTNGRVPGQRPDLTAGRHAHRGPDETVVLPAFLTGRKESKAEATPPEEPELPTDGSLPPSERGMLVFVATLLGAGTIAVVTVLGLGGFSSPAPKAGGDPVPVISSPSPSPSPSASPLPSPAPSSPTDSPSGGPTPKRSTSPARVSLGALTGNDPRAFCAANDAGRAAQHEDHTWYCRGSGTHPPMPFTPTDVCRWRYLDKTAYAVATDIDNPATWKCYT